MNNEEAQHPVYEETPELDKEMVDALFPLYQYIGKHWEMMEIGEDQRIPLTVFMENRIKIRPIYYYYYLVAKDIINKEEDKEAFYKRLLTDPTLNVSPPSTLLAVIRQYISNEFIAFQLSQGSFKTFGAKNYLGYIGGGYIEDRPCPYRAENEGA